MKQSLVLLCLEVLCLCAGSSNLQPLPPCLPELAEKTAANHAANPCNGGPHWLFVDCFTYRDTSVYQLIFDNRHFCPDYVSQTLYYDSTCQVRIEVADGGIKYRHTVSPAGTDLRLLKFKTRIKANVTSVNGSVIPLQPNGEQLRQFYLNMNVENLWQAGQHIDWETGVADKPDATSGNHTHCSAFVAATCKGLNIYILRPPEHKQVLLANAQFEWLPGQPAIAAGWKLVEGNNVYASAQSFANRGFVVVAVCKNPDEKKPGHIAFVLPEAMTTGKLAESGPFVIMAGTHNHNKIALKKGFASHLTGWPENAVVFYYNTASLFPKSNK